MSQNIHSYIIQLQHMNYNTLASTSYDLAIVDWEDAQVSASQLASLHSQGKNTISYLSIGEAEEYRSYWKDSWNNNPPSFLAEENPDWPGNYKVEFWNSEWQNIMLEKVQGIAQAGYGGIFLDLVDSYEYFEQQGRATAAQEMIDFVTRISNLGKSINPEFTVVANNAMELLHDQAYLNVIDGSLKESSWYSGNTPVDADGREWSIEHLQLAQAAGKFVLTLDYPSDTAKQMDFIDQSVEQGFIPFAGTWGLDRLPEVNFTYTPTLMENDTQVADADTSTDTAPATDDTTPTAEETTPQTEETTPPATDVAEDTTQKSPPPILEDQTIKGGSGNDSMAGAQGDDTLEGRQGNDQIFGNLGADSLLGGKHDDIIHGGKDSDYINGNKGADVLYGDLGNDEIHGGKGDDNLIGGDGDDQLYGDKDSDLLHGGLGDDSLYGGKGDDTLEGNEGSDLFVFGKREGHDQILDFNANEDILAISNKLADDFNEAMESAHQDGSDVIFDFGRGQILELDNVDIDDLSADNVSIY